MGIAATIDAMNLGSASSVECSSPGGSDTGPPVVCIKSVVLNCETHHSAHFWLSSNSRQIWFIYFIIIITILVTLYGKGSCIIMNSCINSCMNSCINSCMNYAFIHALISPESSGTNTSSIFFIHDFIKTLRWAHHHE